MLMIGMKNVSAKLTPSDIPDYYYDRNHIDNHLHEKSIVDSTIIPEPDLSAYMTAADIQTNYYNETDIGASILDC